MKKIIREETIEESFEHGNSTATITVKRIKAIQEGEKIIVVIEEDGNDENSHRKLTLFSRQF